MIDCGCPIGEHIPDVEIDGCKEARGQLQKVIFQRIQKTAGAKNSIKYDDGPESNQDIKHKAAMTALMTASDGTKTIISPFMQNPTVEPGGPITFGGGNQTLNGIPIIIDGEPTPVTASFYGESQKTIAQMKKLACEDLGVYLVFEGGKIMCQVDNVESPTNCYPIPIQSLYIGDLKCGNREEPDSNMIQWNFPANWSDNTVVIKRSELDYDPLVELVNKASV